MKMRCNNCDEIVKPRKKFNFIIFLLMSMTGFGALAYLTYYFIFKNAKCPECHSKL